MINVSGMKISDILNMDLEKFNAMDAADLKAVTNRLVSAANKRLRRIEASGTPSPAYRSVMKSGGVFSTQGKDLNALRAEYVRLKNFYESKTSTVRGAKKTQKENLEALRKKGVNATQEQADEMFRLYERLKELDKSVEMKNIKYSVLSDIQKEIESNKDPDNIIQSMREKVSEIYEANQEQYGSSVSSFIDLGESV